MKERPILFSAPMVQAILAGEKTQTRRIIKPQPLDVVSFVGKADEPKYEYGLCTKFSRVIDKTVHCSYGKPGDRLWVRETFRLWDTDMCGCGDRCICPSDGTPVYRCTVNPDLHPAVDAEFRPWRPSIFMPRWASRINLEITGIRVERLQSLNEDDALAEGVISNEEYGFLADSSGVICPTCNGNGVHPALGENYGMTEVDCGDCDAAIKRFRHLWQSINGKRPGCSWNNNPWVWVVEFKRVQ